MVAAIATESQPESNCMATFVKAKAVLKEKFQEEKIAQIFQKSILDQIPELKELAKQLFTSEELRKLGAELIANCVGLPKETMSKIVSRLSPKQKSDVAEQELEIVEKATEDLKPAQEGNLKAWYNNIPTKIMTKASNFKDYVTKKTKKKNKDNK